MTAKTAPIDDPTPAAALARVEAAFAPGPLSDTRAALVQLRVSGDTLLFDGAVDWSLFVATNAHHISGYALSLDEACGDIIDCLEQLSASAGADSEVALALCAADDEDDAKVGDA